MIKNLVYLTLMSAPEKPSVDFASVKRVALEPPPIKRVGGKPSKSLSKKDEKAPSIPELPLPEKESKNVSSNNNETELELRGLRMVVYDYLSSSRFSEHLKTHGFSKLSTTKIEKMKKDELEQLIDQLSFCVAGKSASNYVESLVTGGLPLFEAMMTKYVAEVPGLARSLAANDGFLDLVEEVRLESRLSVRSPKLRLLICVLQTATACYYAGHLRKQALEHQKKTQNVSPVVSTTDNELGSDDEEEKKE
jgi:hypothetical protein